MIGAVGGDVYYFADGKLWKTDGTDAGTIELKSFGDGSHPEADNLTAVGGRLFFEVIGTNNGTIPGLWTSDGTPEGTVWVCRYETSSEIVDVGGTAFFRGSGPNGIGLFRSDGTPDGTRLVGPGVPVPTTGRPMVASGGLLYFESGGQVWRTDGTSAGTLPLTKTGPASPYASRSVLTRAPGGGVYFAAYDLDHGEEPWYSDGTPQGTRLVADMMPGADSSFTSFFSPSGDSLFFVAATPDYGSELWKMSAPPEAAVVGRLAFYNNSSFDGATPGPDADDHAVAPGVRALRGAATTASFSNITNYTKGLNGLLIDIANLPADGVLTTDDFGFRSGNSPDRSGCPIWSNPRQQV